MALQNVSCLLIWRISWELVYRNVVFEKLIKRNREESFTSRYPKDISDLAGAGLMLQGTISSWCTLCNANAGVSYQSYVQNILTFNWKTSSVTWKMSNWLFFFIYTGKICFFIKISDKSFNHFRRKSDVSILKKIHFRIHFFM